MGSEQSSQSSKSQNILKSGSKMKEHQRARSASPGPSISSDSDIPYISYTVNRPIGDSPKLSSKSPAHSLRASATPSPRSSPKAPRPKSYAGSSSGHDIVVVKEGAPSMDTLETDAELIRLQKIPSFHPIMRGALNIPNTTIHDPEVLDKLDYQCILRLCQRYQDHLKMCAETVSTEQNALIQRIREVKVVNLARQINLEVDGDDVQELKMDDLIEMHEQEQDVELESSDPVQSEDRMTVGNLTKSLSLIVTGLQILENTDSNKDQSDTKSCSHHVVELVLIKAVEAQSPYIGVMWKFREVLSSSFDSISELHLLPIVLKYLPDVTLINNPPLIVTLMFYFIDFAINTLTNMLTERQKKFVKYAEQLSKVTEISNNLQKCQTGLKDVIKNMETLNNMLPPEERLEPFVMVTG
ncbi:UNVERIFIED_CONTAM: Borcs5 [Trichonephila clavipes]